MRTEIIKRNTAETQIELCLCLDGKGESRIESGVGFLDHMLTLFAKHGMSMNSWMVFTLCSPPP